MAMDAIETGSAATAVAFGPFRLFPRQRLLTKAGEHVRIGSRAFDILVALLDRPGELVSREELIARVWPQTFVGQTNLAVQIAALRRALDDGRGANRYIVNIPGRGYRFVAPATVEAHASSEPAGLGSFRLDDAPAVSMLPVDGVERIDELASSSRQRRVLTIVQPGGGASPAKAALALLEKVLGADERGVWIVDVTSFGDS